MKRQVYIHAGLPKTGTTTIQQFLFESSEALNDIGVLYPITGRQYNAHHPIASAFLLHGKEWVSPMQPDSMKKQLGEEVRSSGCSKLIISSEVFYFVQEIGELVDLFEGYDLYFLAFLRRQDDWLESAYRQDVKVGEIDPNIDDFLSKRCHQADYFSRIEKWADAIGQDKIVLRLFEPGINSDPLQKQFLDACGISWNNHWQLNESSNTRLNRDCLEFLAHIPDRPRYGSEYNNVLDALADYTKQHRDVTGTESVLSSAQRTRILDKFREGNEKIGQLYFGRRDGKLFNEAAPDPDDSWRPYEGLSPQKAVEIALYVLRHSGSMSAE